MGNIHKDVAKNNGKRCCKSCGNSLVKNGKTRQDKQRWFCKVCNTSRIYKRDVERKQSETKLRNLAMFVDYLLNQSTILKSSGMYRMSFYRKVENLWGIKPTINKPNKADILVTDGTYIKVGQNKKICCIIARDTKHVINYVWSSGEAEEVYKELFNSLPKPRAIVTDGARGSSKCSKETIWR
jgi:transposase-like protein